MVRTIVVVAAVLTALGETAARQESAARTDLSGVYLCEGKNPDGSPYRGVVQIAAIGDTYLVQWTLANDLSVLGVGILRGDTLAVSYFSGTSVIVVYKTTGDRLAGEWTMGGTEGAVFTETLTLMELSPGHPAVRPAIKPKVGIRAV